MSKKQETRSDRPLDELSLDSLDVVIGGSSGAPMGLGSALPAPHPSATSPLSAASPGGYTDHFGLQMGGASAVHATSALPEAAASHGPIGLGGNMAGTLPTHDSGTASSTTGTGAASTSNSSGQALDNPTDNHATDNHATTGHAGDTLGVNAGSAFQLLDEAAQDLVPHASTPQGLGGNSN